MIILGTNDDKFKFKTLSPVFALIRERLEHPNVLVDGEWDFNKDVEER